MEAREVAGFEILGELAKHRAGAVYKAREVATNRVVALKVCRSADPVMHQRLCHAAQCMAHFQHQGIVAAYGVGGQEGESYISMELVEGGRLAERLGRPWPAQQAVQLIERLANAVQAMHELGLIHREIDPTHILFSSDGQPKLSGFRFAYCLALGQADGVGRFPLVGDPSYISPEQAIGSGLPDFGADIYAVGAVLYALLTGRPPFREATVADTIRQVVEQEPTPPSQWEPSVPRKLEAIYMKCLAKDPKDRYPYPSAQALADDLRRYLKESENGLLRILQRGLHWLFRRSS